jgi:hypothetical protein
VTETQHDDPFSRPSSGNFPKVEDLEGSLLLIRPSKVEMVTNRFDRDGSKPMVERATADVVVFGPEGTEEYGDMYLSQAVLLGACKQALKPGAKPFVLGRLVKLATRDTQEKLKIDNTPEAFATAREAWLKKGGKGTEPKHVWVLQDFTDEDAQKARDFIASKARNTDPFAASE